MSQKNMVIGVKNHGQRNRKPWATKFTTMGNENQAVAPRFFKPSAVCFCLISPFL